MKNPIIIGTVVTVLVLGGIGGFMTIRPLIATRQSALQMAPIDATKRLTTFFLERRIERLRASAIALQHDEEGGKILRMMEEDTQNAIGVP